MANTKYSAVSQGKLYIASRDISGLTSGYTEIGDADQFQITTTQSFTDIYESQSGNRSIVAHIPNQSDYAASIAILNIDGVNLARAFYGDNAAVTGATVTAEAAVGYNDSSFFTKYPGISSVVVNKAGTPLVVDTDYTVDGASGEIKILAGSTGVPAGPGVALTVNYTHAGVAARVRGMTSGIKDFSLKFVGKSKFDDKIEVATIHRIALEMASTLDLISTGVTKLPIKGKLLPALEQTAGESQYFTVVQK